MRRSTITYSDARMKHERPYLPALALSAILLMAAGCSDSRREEPTDKKQETGLAAKEKRALSFGSVAYDSLWDKAGRAVQEGRTVAPAGNNAVEFYLQIRQGYPDLLAQQSKPTQAQTALLDTLNRLGPDVSLGIDQAVSRGDLAEASRLLRMLAAIDAQYPSLPRQIEQVERATEKSKARKQ